MDEEQSKQTKNYAADIPYPSVCVSRPDISYGRAMLDNLGGSNSEMSAVSLYFYNHLITACEQELSLCFHKISIVEMHHMEIFGQIAIQCGLDPRMWTQRNRRFVYWTPNYNQYPGNLGELLKHSIEREKSAVAKYTYQANNICDENIKENLNRIILDETLHIEILTGLYKQYVC